LTIWPAFFLRFSQEKRKGRKEIVLLDTRQELLFPPAFPDSQTAAEKSYPFPSSHSVLCSAVLLLLFPVFFAFSSLFFWEITGARASPASLRSVYLLFLSTVLGRTFFGFSSCGLFLMPVLVRVFRSALSLFSSPSLPLIHAREEPSSRKPFLAEMFPPRA